MPKDAPGEPNKRYGKLLTRLTGPSKPREMATIQAFCAWRDPSNGGRAVAFGAQTWSRAAPALRLSLPHRHLVNSVDGVPASRRHPAAHRHPTRAVLSTRCWMMDRANVHRLHHIDVLRRRSEEHTSELQSLR